MPGDHFYCTNFHGEAASWSGYEREGVAGYVYKTSQPGTVPISRYFNDTTGDHFYTANPSGEQLQSYRDEGIELYMYKDQRPGTTAFYRWYNSTNGDHFYTTDSTGELAPVGGYVFESVLGFLYPKNTAPDIIPLHRWYQSGLMSKFTFSNNITPEQRNGLYERHSWAYYRAGITDQLSGSEQDLVRRIYREEKIEHDVNTTPGVMGSAYIGGRQLFINFGVLFPYGDDEISQTLLHEMMHCVGYTHPAKSGTPGDGGQYFNSAPLRAELAIAGRQSDAAMDAMADTSKPTCCVIDADAEARMKEARAPPT